jgi:hypothetical protein
MTGNSLFIEIRDWSLLKMISGIVYTMLEVLNPENFQREIFGIFYFSFFRRLLQKNV